MFVFCVLRASVVNMELVLLNSFVMRYVSFPVYVKVAHMGVGVLLFLHSTFAF
jgi:hypothetical protein